MADKITPAQERALRTASRRPNENFCPVIGVHAAAETRLIEALDRRGFVTWDGPAPRISDAGRAAIARAEAEPR